MLRVYTIGVMKMATIAEDIKTTVLEFIKDLKDNVFINPTEQGELALVEFFFKKMNNTSVADHVVSHVLRHEKEISKRNISFFIDERNNIFSGLPKDRIDHFTKLITAHPHLGGLTEDDKNHAWEYFETLVSLAKQYKKNK